MNVPHIAIIPYLTCNFSCSYCCANKFSQDSLKLWHSKADDMIKFLNSIDRKMIMVSGGEPLLYDWHRFIEETDHYWYFATNASVIPKFLSEHDIKEKVKLFIAAFHREGMNVGRFIKNALKLQDMGYAIFCKIIYTKEEVQFKEWEEIANAGLLVSFVPLVGGKYSKEEIARVIPYCQSALYASRFYELDRRLCGNLDCVAGTAESFELRMTSIVRCGLQDVPVFANIAPPKFLKRILRDDWNDLAIKLLHVASGRKNPFLGNIYEPKFYQSPMPCRRQRCECEWHTFSGMGVDVENWKWQGLIDTGRWIPTTQKRIKEFVAKSGGQTWI
jgi:hypothetical protein